MFQCNSMNHLLSDLFLPKYPIFMSAFPSVINKDAKECKTHNKDGLNKCSKLEHTSCSIPLYSPSVFSRIVTTSTLSYKVLWPSSDRHGRTLAYRLNSLKL